MDRFVIDIGWHHEHMAFIWFHQPCKCEGTSTLLQSYGILMYVLVNYDGTSTLFHIMNPFNHRKKGAMQHNYSLEAFHGQYGGTTSVMMAFIWVPYLGTL